MPLLEVASNLGAYLRGVARGPPRQKHASIRLSGRHTHLPCLREGVAVAEVAEGDERLVTLCIGKMSPSAQGRARLAVCRARRAYLELEVEDGGRHQTRVVNAVVVVVDVVDGVPVVVSRLEKGSEVVGKNRRTAAKSERPIV